MKIMVISGGTGSIKIKENLSKYIHYKNLYTLINCYDNGLSTGLVRKVFNGNILGPSDARKQQFLDYKLYRDEVKTDTSEKVYNTLNKRITIYDKPEEKILNLVSELPEVIIKGVNIFFEQPLSREIKYIDFSLANIVYGGLAYKYNSLQKAINIMADILNLPQNIIINSDENLYLCAITKDKKHIYDEYDIVNWGRNNDKIEDIYLCDIKGKETIPELSNLAKQSIKNVDLIICSPGTQFSSLIPTYKTKGFLESIKNKKVCLIKNYVQDEDMIGYTHDEEIKKILQYIPIEYIDKIYSHTKLNIQKLSFGNYVSDGFHNLNLIQDIFENYYNYKNEKHLILDYDDTIYSRSNKDIKISLDNISVLQKLKNKGIIIDLATGKHIDDIIPDLKCDNYYTCYGSSVYDKNRKKIKTINVLSPNEINKIYDILKGVGFNISKIENRDNIIISLRYLDKEYRDLLFEYLKEKLKNLYIVQAGKKTIDIMLNKNNKYKNLLNYIDNFNNIYYIGDELYGNDKEMIRNINSLNVKDVYDTNTFLKFILDYCNEN